MYLLTSNDDIYRRTANCFCKDGIEFGYAVLKNTSPHNYALFMAARDLCDKTEAVTMADLAEPEVIDPEALRLIVNATLIARYGLAAFQIRVFQLPLIMFVLAKMGFVSYSMLAKYRKHGLIIIMIVAAIITAPDLMTLILVTIPLYLLYEISVID